MSNPYFPSPGTIRHMFWASFFLWYILYLSLQILQTGSKLTLCSLWCRINYVFLKVKWSRITFLWVHFDFLLFFFSSAHWFLMLLLMCYLNFLVGLKLNYTNKIVLNIFSFQYFGWNQYYSQSHIFYCSKKHQRIIFGAEGIILFYW